jgi:hypothetical protein
MAGGLGFATTLVGLVAAFLPTADVVGVWTFELKLITGVVGPTLVGWYLFRRASPAAAR